MWSEITALQIGRRHYDRIKREWLFGQWVPETNVHSYDATPVNPLKVDLNNEFGTHCCTCHQVSTSLIIPNCGTLNHFVLFI